MGYIQTHENVGRKWLRTVAAWVAGVATLAAPALIAPQAFANQPAPSPGAGSAAGAHDQANARAGKDVIAIAFQENWNSVAKECTDVYGPEGVGYVEISPAQESIKGKQWWTSYQPVSYKLDSKEGTEAQFKHMLGVCNAAGVGVIADVVLNHMTGSTQGARLIGVAGSPYQTDKDTTTSHSEDYPAVPYTSADFHDCTKVVSNYKDANEVRTCRLTGLRDLNTSSPDVQEKEATYLAKLWNLGVAGFRVDGAKHMDPADLLAIKRKLGQKVNTPIDQIPWTQEVIDNGGEAEALQPHYYYQTGRVTEFSYAYQLRQDFQGNVANLKNLAVDPEAHTSVDSAHADAFVDNWDTERGQSTLSLKDGRQFQMANAFLLADNYGQPRIYSGYEVKDHDAGAPGATDTSIPDTVCPTKDNKTGWTCLERWTAIRGMIGFHNAVTGTTVTNWQNPVKGVIAFNRGNKGTFALNNTTSPATVTLTTGLPDGQYCDVYATGNCSKTVTVASGKADVTIDSQTALAFYSTATKSSWKGTQKSDPTDQDFPLIRPDQSQADPVTTVYYKLPAGQNTAYIHYGVNGSWTIVPGKKMNRACDGYVKYDVNNQHAKNIEAVFNDGNNHWDNYHNEGSANYVLSGPYVTVQNHDWKLGNPCPVTYNPTTTLTVHYKPQNASDTRGVYVWGDKKDGGSLAGEHHAFTGTDSWGKVITLHLPGAYEKGKLGLIITTNDWNKFGDQDRHPDASNGAATVWIDGTNPTDQTETPTTIPDSVRRQIKTLNVIVHYNRPDSNYADWDLWHWNAGADGTATKFTSHDDFGVIAKYTEASSDGVQGSSIIFRQGGSTWAGKDGQDNLAIPDDAIHITNPTKGIATAEVWVASANRDAKNDPILYANGSVINMGQQVRSATATGARTIDVQLSKPIAASALPAAVTMSGATLASVTVDPKDSSRLIITTRDDIDPARLITVSVAHYSKDVKVNLGGYVRSAAFDSKYDYSGKLGPHYSANSTEFKLWAPTAQSVKLNTYTSDRSSNAALKQSYPMVRGTRTGELGLWTVTVPGDVKDTAYDFTLTFADGTTNTSPDPYATAATINGDRSVVLAPSETTISNFNRMPTFRGGPTAAVIGETDIRDLTNSPTSGVTASKRGTYLGVIEKGTKNKAGLPTGLNYLKKSGVTHVQFQPMFQFASIDESKPRTDKQYNWGYDPKNYNVPEGWYASDVSNPATRILEMKQMVKGLHKAGLRVNMDVVYNHVYDASKQALGLTVPGYYFRYDSNGALSNGSGCGNDVASERGMARKYIVDSVTYWAKNYKLDGFRFDLMGLLDQTTMNRVRDALNQIDPGILVYGEGWTMANMKGISPSLVADQQHANKVSGASFFDDAIRDDVKGSVFDAHGKGFVTGKNNGLDIARDMLACLSSSTGKGDACTGSGQNHYVTPGQLLQYVEAHDNRTLYDTLAISMFANKNSDTMPKLTATQDAAIMKAVRLSNAVVALAQGMPFIQIGQSFGRTKGGDSNSYVSPDSVNDIDWDLETKNKATETYTEALLTLRKNMPAFRLASYADIARDTSVLTTPAGIVALKISVPASGSTRASTVYAVLNSTDKNVTSVTGIPAGTYSALIHGDSATMVTPVTIGHDGSTGVGTSIAAPESATILVPKGEEPAIYSTITFNANGGKLAAGSTQQMMLDGFNMILPANPTRDGYTFQGWNTKADGTGTSVTAHDVVSRDLTLHALWKKNSEPDQPDHPSNPDNPNNPNNPDHPSKPTDPLAGCPANPFVDAQTGWAANAIRYVNCKGVMTGYDNKSHRFGTNDWLLRVDAATLLWRRAGRPTVRTRTHYRDQKRIPAYARMAVDWAAQNHVMNGYGSANTFGAGNYLTRQEAAKIMARASGAKVGRPSKADLASYMRLFRAKSTFPGLLDYMVWAHKNGVINGWDMAAGRDANPWGRVSRGQMAMIMANAMQKGVFAAKK